MNAAAKIIEVDAIAPDAAAIAEAAAVLRAGRLVAFPTETVYGLGANALDADAVARIFAAKSRPGYNPLIVHVPDTSAIRGLVSVWPELAARLAAAFWPGPLTLVVPKSAAVPSAVTAGLETVAVRVPAHPVAQALLRAAAVPVAAPSANRFMRLSPTSAAHVARGLGDRVDLILDGGDTPVGIESTVLDLTPRRPTLLRPGVISEAELRAVIGDVARVADHDTLAARGSDGPGDERPRPAPGMLDRHYAPDAELRVVGSGEEAKRLAAEAHGAGRVVGALPRTLLNLPADHVIAMPSDARGYARLLYAALHSLDDAGCDLVLVEQLPDAGEWDGVRDRLRRAAG
jgi:L-threonylcarbamoyladenylate synthase